MQQAGPQRTHSSDFILWTWTLPQVPKCSRPSTARKIHTGQALIAMVVLHFVPLASKTLTQQSSLERKTFGYDCNLGSLKRERTLHPRPYLLRACKRLAQTFKLVTALFGQAL